jgi:hypothetical protein
VREANQNLVVTAKDARAVQPENMPLPPHSPGPA